MFIEPPFPFFLVMEQKYKKKMTKREKKIQIRQRTTEIKVARNLDWEIKACQQILS